MSDSGKALDRIAQLGITPLLKQRGFRKTGRTWRRPVPREGAIQVVNLQGSAWNDGVAGHCALNAGIYFAAMPEWRGIGAVTDRPTEPDCHLRVRPAMLRPGALDTWFEYRADETASLETAAASLAELFVEYAEPWLERFSSLAAARDELVRTGQRWPAAAASLALGDTEGAAALLAEAIAKAPKAFAPTLEAWGNRHSLLEYPDADI